MSLGHEQLAHELIATEQVVSSKYALSYSPQMNQIN